MNFLTRLKETQAQETLPSENSIVVSEAYAPSRPQSARRTATVLVVTLLGLLLGYLASLLADLRRSSAFWTWTATLNRVITAPAGERFAAASKGKA